MKEIKKLSIIQFWRKIVRNCERKFKELKGEDKNNKRERK